MNGEGAANRLNCLLCGKELSMESNPPGIEGIPFCLSHFDAPGNRVREKDETVWVYRRSQEDWYLFRPDKGAGGTPGQGLRADWRAVNVSTGEVRQFTHIGEIDVWLDVLDIKKAPPGEYPAWWGQKSPLGPDGRPDMKSMMVMMAEQGWGFQRDASGAPVLPKLQDQVASTRVPVYGLADKPYGLELGSLSGGSSNGGNGGKLGITSLIFMNAPQHSEIAGRTEEYLFRVRQEHLQQDVEGRKTIGFLSASSRMPPRYPPVPTKSIELGSSYGLTYDSPPLKQLRPWRLSSPRERFALLLYNSLNDQIRGRLTEGNAYQLCRQAQTILWSGLPDLVDEVAASEVELFQQNVTIDGAEFWGDILYWHAPIPVSVFRFAHTVALPVILYLTGSSYGVNRSELFDLMRHIVVVNDKPEVLAQYDDELGERGARLRGGYQ